METQDYESLTDPHLNAYFNNKRIRRHLIKAGLINRHGDILPPPSYEVVLAQRGKRKEAKEKLSHTIINYVIEEERKRQAFIRDQFDFAVKRSRIQKIHESRHQQQLSILNTLVQVSKPPKSRNARTPSPTTRKRSSTRAKSAHHPTKNVKYQLARRPPSAKQSSNDDYCEVTMMYYGPQIAIEHDSARVQPYGDEIVVMQQHCGGENLVVFKGFVKPNETFTFESRRHPGYPFAVAIYINGLIDSRISVCCEYKHSRNVRLGSTRGLFGIYDVRKSKPCIVCQYAKRNKKNLSNSDIPDNSARYRKSVVPRIPFTTEFGSGDILRTPKSSPERQEQISKDRINRISTAAQASPRTQSPASLKHKDETENNVSTSTLATKSSATDQQQIDKKKDTRGKTLRVPSSTSKKAGPSSATVTFENEDPPHSSEPIVTKENTDVAVKKKGNDSPRSSASASKKSGSVPIRISDDNADRRILKTPSMSSAKSSPSPAPILNKKADSRRLRSPSTSSSEGRHSPVPFSNNKTESRRLRSPSTSSSEGRHSPVPFLNNEDHRRRKTSSSTSSSERHPSPARILNNEDDRQPLKSPSIASSKSSSVPIPIFNDEDDRQSLRSSSTSTVKSSPSSPPILNDEDDQHSSQILSKKDDPRDHFFSSSSSTTSKGRDSSLSDFYAKKDDHPTSTILTEKIDTKRKSSISSTSTVTTPDLSTKIKPDSKLIKGESDRHSSSSSSATQIINPVLPPDNQYEKQRDSSRPSSKASKSSDHSVKIVTEPHRSPTHSIDNQQTNDNINESDDDDDSKSESKPTRRNQDEEPVSATPVKKTPVRQYHSVENIIVIWLDAEVDANTTDIISTKVQLRQIARTIRTFTDPEKCLQLIKEIKHEKIFLIVSGSLSENVLPRIDYESQVAVIYIFCQQYSKYQHLTTKYPKIKKIYTDIWKICEDLKVDSKQWNNDLSTFQVTSSIDDDNNPLTSEQLLFIQNQLFKEYLLDIQYDGDALGDLVEYCDILYTENETEKELIKQFKENYNQNEALNWYTKDCFIYHMLNKAIRMKDIKILFQMGFLLHDINQQLENIYSTTVHRSTLTVFRGQGMKLEYFEELKQNQGGLISFNGFVSTSTKQNIAYDFAKRSLSNGFPIAVLFRMKIDPKNSSNPFASVENQSANQYENEILFSFKTIFHIESIEQIENNLWQIDLNLINEKENKIVQFIQIERQKLNHLVDYEKLGELLIEMNEFDRAKDIYDLNLPNITNPKYTFVYKQLALISKKLDADNQAIFYYDLALRTKSNETLNDYVTISDIHNQIGKIYYKQNKFREALEKFQYALKIQLDHLSSEHPALIDTYGCLANTYEDNDEYETALEYYEKQLRIQKNLSSSNQSDLALTHYRIAICLENLERSDEAMNHIQQSIDKTPSNDYELNERQVALERIREQLD